MTIDIDPPDWAVGYVKKSALGIAWVSKSPNGLYYDSNGGMPYDPEQINFFPVRPIPCPKCGAKARLHDRGVRFRYRYECANGHAWDSWHDTPEEALEDWKAGGNGNGSS